MIAALPVIIAAVGTLFVLISVGVLEWHLYTTRRSDVTGQGANPSAADQIVVGAGTAVGGAGETVGALGSSAGGWVPFAVLGVAAIALFGGRR